MKTNASLLTIDLAFPQCRDGACRGFAWQAAFHKGDNYLLVVIHAWLRQPDPAEGF